MSATSEKTDPASRMLPLANPITVEAAAAARKELWQTGFRPVAVYNPDQTWHTSPGKAPQGNGWEQRAQRSIPEAATLQPHPRATNTGIWSGGLRPADIDVDDPGIVKQIRDILAEYTFDDVPVRGREGSPRELHLYRAAEGAPAKRSIVGKLGKLEFLGFGNQFVAYGGHPDGGSYIPPVGGYGVADALPALTEEQVTEIFARVAPLIGAVPPKAEPGEHTSGEAQADPLRIAAALNDIPNDGPPDWEKWNNAGMASFRATGGNDLGLAAWEAWSARNPANGVKDSCARRWDNYRSSPPSRIGAGTLFYMAAQARAEAAEAQRAANVFAEGLAKIKKDEQDKIDADVAAWVLNAPAAAKAVFGGSGPLAEALESHRIGSMDGGGNQGLYDYLARDRALSEEDRKDQEARRAKENAPLSSVVVTAKDLLAQPEVPTEWILDGLIEKGVTNYLKGQEQSFKSWLDHQTCYSVALGEPVIGRQVMKCTAVYVSYEDAGRELKRRQKKIMRGMGISEAPGNMLYFDMKKGRRGPLVKIDRQGAISTTKTWDELRRYLRAVTGHKFVVFDSGYNVFSFAGGTRNFDDDAVNAALGRLDELCADCDCTLDVLHHPSREGVKRSDMGGAQAWDAFPRSRRSMALVKDSEDTITLTHEKCSHGRKTPDITLRFNGDILVLAGAQAPAERGEDLMPHIRTAVLEYALDAARDGAPLTAGGGGKAKIPQTVLDVLSRKAGCKLSDDLVRDVLIELRAQHKLRLHTRPSASHYAPAGYYKPIASVDDLDDAYYRKTITGADLDTDIALGSCPKDIRQQLIRYREKRNWTEMDKALNELLRCVNGVPVSL